MHTFPVGDALNGFVQACSTVQFKSYNLEIRIKAVKSDLHEHRHECNSTPMVYFQRSSSIFGSFHPTVCLTSTLLILTGMFRNGSWTVVDLWVVLFFKSPAFFPVLNVLVQALSQYGSLLPDCVDILRVDSAEEVPIEVLRQREAKWLEMLNSWDKWMAKKHKKVCLGNCQLGPDCSTVDYWITLLERTLVVGYSDSVLAMSPETGAASQITVHVLKKQVKERCQKGIPPSLRGRAWLYLTGGKVKREQNAGKYQVSHRSDWYKELLVKRAHVRLEKAQMWPISYGNPAVFFRSCWASREIQPGSTLLSGTSIGSFPSTKCFPPEEVTGERPRRDARGVREDRVTGALRPCPQAAGPLRRPEGLQSVPPRRGLLPGSGSRRCRSPDAHASRGEHTSLPCCPVEPKIDVGRVYHSFNVHICRVSRLRVWTYDRLIPYTSDICSFIAFVSILWPRMPSGFLSRSVRSTCRVTTAQGW